MRLICLFEIIEEKDKSTLIYPEIVPWPSLMEVIVGHQHKKWNPPQRPLQPVPRPSTINGDCWPTWPSESEDTSPDLPGSSSSSISVPASGTSGSERVAWKMLLDMLAGSGCSVKAKHKSYNLYIIRSRCAGELFLCRAVWRIHPLIIVTVESKATRTRLHYPPPYLKKRRCVSTSLMLSAAPCVHQDTRQLH